jgi:tripartite-type tricarboxylate transporter receptor subunit TctC
MLYKKLSYDPDRELRVLAIVTDTPAVMIVHPSVPAKSVAEFVAHARQNSGKLNFGSAGTGGVGHLSGEMFKLMAGIEMTHVPYKGAGPALADLIAGHIQATFETLGNRALDDEVFRTSLTRVGFPPQRSRNQAEIDKFVAADRARWAAVIKALNISLD